MVNRCYAAALAACLLVSACATVQGVAKDTIELSAHGLKGADIIVASQYTEVAAKALEESNTIVEYKSAMGKWDDAVQALTIAKGALLSAENALQIWVDSGQVATFQEAGACLIASLAELRDVLALLKVELPEAIHEAINLAQELPLGSCGITEDSNGAYYY